MNTARLQEIRIERAERRRPRRALWIILIFVSGVTALAVYFAWPRQDDNVRVRNIGLAGRATEDRGAQAAPLPTPTPPVLAGTAREQPGSVLTVSGYIVNRARIELSPRFQGVVKWIGVKKGDAVAKDQVVVLLDDAEQRARLLEAEGALARARADLERSLLDFNRAKRLRAQRVESQEFEDQARVAVDAARANVRQAEGAVQYARSQLEWTEIRSPIDGVVLEKLVDAGELVTPQSFGGTRGPSTAVLAVADPNDLQVEIDVNESDLAKVTLAQRCRVSPEAYPDRAYGGFVAEIAPEANRQKGTLQVKVQIEKPDRFLTPELSARVDFLKDSSP